MPTNMRSPEGGVVSVPDSEIRTWEIRGYKPVSAAEKAGEETRAAVLDDFSNPTGAFLGSAASGATLGLTDYLFADKTTELEREADPNLALAGQIAGAVVPSLLAPGSGAAAGIAKYTPAGAVSLLGAKVGALGAKSGAIAKVGAIAAGGAIEGAAQSSGAYISQMAIADKPLTAEGFVAAAGNGALFGGAVGGAVGVVAQGATSARRLFAGSEVSAQAARQAAAAAGQRMRQAKAAADEGIMVTRRRMAEIQLEDLASSTAAKRAKEEYGVLEAQHRARSAQSTADIAERQAREAAERGAPLTQAEIKAREQIALSDAKIAGKTAESDIKLGAKAKSLEQAELRKAAKFDADMAAREKTLELELKAKGKTDAQKLKTQKELDKVRVDRTRAAAKGKSMSGSRSTAPKADLVDQTDDVLDATPIGMVDDVPPLPSLDDYIDDAVAKVNPEAARIVAASRKLKRSIEGMTRIDPEQGMAAAAKATKRAPSARATDTGVEWKVVAPQGQGGHIWISSDDLAVSTLGRIKKAFEGASPDQRALVESMMPPKRVAAVKQLEAGEARHMPGWFNRDHHFEGFDFDVKKLADSEDIAATRQQVWAVRSQLDNYNQDPSYFREADNGKLRSFAEEAPFIDQHGDVYDAETLAMIGVIGDFDKGMQELATALGDATPKSLADEVAELMGVVAKSEDNDVASLVASIDDQADAASRKDASRIARGSDPDIRPPDDMPPSAGAVNTNEVMPAAQVADDAGAAAARSGIDVDRALGNVDLPDMPVAANGGAGRALGYAADAGAALEAIQMLGGAIPGVPRISEIPLIGPILSTILKARAAWGIFSRVGGKIPATVEGNVAMRAASTRDRIRQAADKLLAGVDQGARAAKRVAVPANAALERVLFSSGASTGSGGGLPARLQELAYASNNPQDVEKRIRENVPSGDAELVAGIIAVAKAKLSFLQDKAPKDPRPPSMILSSFMPSRAHTETFARYVRAADDPASVFEDAAAGQLNTEGIEALRAIYPRLYGEAQMQLMDRADKLQISIPYSRRLLLGSLFDIAIDGTLTPEYRSAMAAASQAGGPPPGNAPQGAAPSIAGSAAKVAQMADPNANRKRGAM